MPGHSSAGLEASGDPAQRRRPGRPRLTYEEIQARIAAYGARYGVAANEDGLPPFPSGRRETVQHREWMGLYKAHQRLSRSRAPAEPRGAADGARVVERLQAQAGRCFICRKPLDSSDARLDVPEASHPGPRGAAAGAVALHARCQQLVQLSRSVGRDALDRVKDRL